jgi:hypothetical protein
MRWAMDGGLRPAASRRHSPEGGRPGCIGGTSEIRHHWAVASESGDDVVEFFAARRFEVRVKRQNQTEKFRRLGLADAATAHDPFWVDLVWGGSVTAPHYGSGSSEIDALRSAMRRWVVEQAT